MSAATTSETRPAPPPITVAGHTAAAKSGALAATCCYFLWGLVPIYWKQLAGINAVELIAHRHVWSLVFVLVIATRHGNGAAIRNALATPRSIAVNFLSATLLTANWLIYVWGVNTGHVIECSLGYFLVPLVNVGAGRFVLHEHLRRAQWIAIAFAALGVCWMIFQLGRAPWIALSIAATWGAYGLMRKKSPLGSVAGLTVETLLLAPFAIAFLIWQNHTGEGALGRVGPGLHVLIFSSGVITAIPLLLFAYGARRLRLSTLGLLQYVAPTVQFTLGLLLYHEPFSRERLESFGLIWLGLALYTVDNLVAQRQLRRTAGG
jgi:chloramphenicol-sensitive protein RarD